MLYLEIYELLRSMRTAAQTVKQAGKVFTAMMAVAETAKGMANAVPVELLMDIEQKSMAYGWEVGHGAPMSLSIPPSADNPFLRENWMNELRNV